jgi:hypothetical protein
VYPPPSTAIKKKRILRHDQEVNFRIHGVEEEGEIQTKGIENLTSEIVAENSQS